MMHSFMQRFIAAIQIKFGQFALNVLGKPNYPLPKGQFNFLIHHQQILTGYNRLYPFQYGFEF